MNSGTGRVQLDPKRGQRLLAFQNLARRRKIRDCQWQRSVLLGFQPIRPAQ
jgi:hypothetical protein